MNERNNKMELLGSAPIPKALIALGVPIMIGMLINAFYNLVDAYFVGGLGESPMGAISIVFPLGQVIVGLGLMFGNGAASYLSRLLGRGDREAANKAASTAVYSSVIIGAIFIIFAAVFIRPILTLLGATDTIMPYALTYARIYIISCIFNVMKAPRGKPSSVCSASEPLVLRPLRHLPHIPASLACERGIPIFFLSSLYIISVKLICPSISVPLYIFLYSFP